jgi:phosphoglycolate phosphatase
MRENRRHARRASTVTDAPRYRLAVFDFDGTLADSFPFFLDVFAEIARAHGFRELSREHLLALRGASAREMMGHVGMPAWKLPRVALHFRRLMAEQRASIRLFPGVAALLQRLHAAGVRIAVLTSNGEDNVRAMLGPELAALVSDYECGVAMFGKRHRLRRVVARSGVSPADVLTIGDELRDLDAARACGVAFGAVSWGFTTRAALAARDPDFLFETPEEIERAMRS